MRFKCSILFTFFMMFVLSAFSQQGTIQGKVITSDEQPAQAISISLKDTRYFTTTDETGNFLLKVPAGSYFLLVQSVGNKETIVPVEVTAENATVLNTIKLSQTLQQLPEVVVTGQYEARSLKNSVYKVRVIDRERIQMRAATDLSGVLNTELGIRFSTDYTLGETDIQLLGIGGQRVKILLDGVPLADRDDTRQSLSQIDINTIDRIEIVEGPMSVIYGTDGLGGVINIITKKAGRTKSFGINARIQEESIGNTYSPFYEEGIHNQHLGVNWSNGNWNTSLYGTRNNFGGYTDTVAYPAKLAKPKDQWIAGGTLGFQKENFNLLYRLDYLDESIFAAGIMNVNNGKAQDKYYITNRYTHQLQNNWQLSSNLKINTAVSYQDYKRNTETYAIDHVAKSKSPTDLTGGWDVTRFKTWFVRSTAQWFISPKISLQPGVDMKWDQTSGDRILDKKQSIADYSFFISTEYKPLDWINIRPGIRLSKNSVYDAPPVIPSLNTKFSLNKDWDVRASYGRGFRAPILRELYFYYYDANHSIEGNADLKAEYSNSYMASINWSNHRGEQNLVLSSSFAGFYNDYFDFITTAQRTGSTVFTYLNIDKYKTTGVIWDNKINYRNLSGTLGFSYIGRYNRYRELDKQTAAFTWAPEINSNITYNFTRLKASLGLYYKFTGEIPVYNLSSTNTVSLAKISPYHWADLTATKQLFKYITLTAGVKNLLNVRWVGSTVESGGVHTAGGNMLTGYGTSYFAGIRFNWNK